MSKGPLEHCFPTTVMRNFSVPCEIIRCGVENAQFYIIGAKMIYSTEIMCLLCMFYVGSMQWQAEYLKALPLNGNRQ